MSIQRTVVVLVFAVAAGISVAARTGALPGPSGPEMETRAGLALEPAPGTPTPHVDASPVYTLKVNLDEIGPAGPGRDLTIMNCDYCHSWTCAVRGQRTTNHWRAVAETHKVMSRVILRDDDWTTLFSYLEQNFDDHHPVPALPTVYQDLGCSYAESSF